MLKGGVIKFKNKKAYKRCVSKKKSCLKYVALESGKENNWLKIIYVTYIIPLFQILL